MAACEAAASARDPARSASWGGGVIVAAFPFFCLHGMAALLTSLALA
jgi:hypothetical protein